MNISEEKIQEIQQNILNGVQAEQDELTEIEMLAQSIANRLISKNHTTELFLGTQYIFNLNCDRSSKRITVMVTDPVKMQLANGHYKPMLLNGEWDDSFTFEENVYAVVKAGLCYKAGRMPIQETTDI